MQVVLASASPRRHELLKALVPHFTVIPSHIDEVLDPALPVGTRIERLALEKAQSVANTLTEPTLVIGADTVVCIHDEILGKPQDEADADRMLTQLGNCWHEVITAIALLQTGPNPKVQTAHAVSRVYMRAMTPAERKAYIASGEPMDKAGAYAIQGQAGAYIETIEGSYENIVGLPVQLLAEHLPAFLG